MLRTRERTLLLETLRPPPGYSLDQAIGTSYTLDLHALLVAPLAFTFFHHEDESGSPTADPVALLEALRRHAEHITIFCQAGAIALPKPQQTLLAFLERSVVQVGARKKGGIFHPKIWLVRFVADDQPVRYRFLCLSRNLTFHRAWDTCLVLDGELEERKRAFARNRPLADLIAALPTLATRRPSAHAVERAILMATEVPFVDFEVPGPFEAIAFHPLGLEDRNAWSFPAAQRSLVISPYLTEWAVRHFAEKLNLQVLVSRPESLDALATDILPGSGTYVLSSGARLDAQMAEEEASETTSVSTEGTTAEQVELTGLHAKLFLIENGATADAFVGSANATTAAFQRNVELLVQLTGKRKQVGIAALLGGSEEQRTNDGLQSLLQSYVRSESGEDNEAQRALERDLQLLAAEVASAELQVFVEAGDEEALFELRLRGELPALPAGTSVRFWPSTFSSEHGREVAAGGTIEVEVPVTFEAITAFWGVELELHREGRSATHRFVAWYPLVGAPTDRRERILHSLLKDSRQVLRLLLLLLSREELDVQAFAQGDSRASGRWGAGSAWSEPTLLEALLESLSRDPKQVDRAARLIEDLRRTPEGRELLPPELDAIWEPVWRARSAIGKAAREL
jgi:hypothetical protein